MTKNLVAVSVADLPLNVSWEKCFALAAQNRADGVELMGGPRAWWNRKKIESWTRKLKLPVVSVHQPAWEILGLFVSSANLVQAGEWARGYVIHPPLLRGDEGSGYFDRLQTWGRQRSMRIMLENMPPVLTIGWMDYIGKTEEKWVDIQEVARECRRRRWAMTLDTSHWQKVSPDEGELKTILPVLENIHISDWDSEKQHLSLGKGVMDVEAWMRWIGKNYHGQVTLELTPKYWVDTDRYLNDLAESLKIMRQWLKD